ncbi:hypothetical protein DLH72_05075 [Candidatus Gracilibacteria bacterium]|nr:MAG: hypothetical protein DLH72_05075 [Candidatus Gracilibacteria bacterium]
MFNFWTKKKKDELLKNKNKVQDFYNNSATAEQQEKIKKVAENTQNQNFSAAEYNEQARKNGEENWQNAYRNDILGINQKPETEIQKKHRLFAEEQARQEAEYQKRIAEEQQKEQVTKEQEIQKKKAEMEAMGGAFITQDESNKYNEEVLKAQQEAHMKRLNGDIYGDKTSSQGSADTSSQPSPQGEGVENTQNENSPSTPKEKEQGRGVDYENWNVEGWKARGSSKEELENAVEKKYGTVATWKEDGSLEAVINGEKISWKIDENGNPVKTSLGAVNQAEISRNQVSQMIQMGNSTAEINDYIYKNNLQNDPIIKKQISQKHLDDYERPIIEKYKNASVKEIHKAVSEGELIPGSSIFNKLPQAEAYMKVKDSLTVIDIRKDKDYTAYNSAIDIEKIIENHMSKIFDISGIKEIADRFKNDEEIKKYREDIYSAQRHITNTQKQIKDLGAKIRSNMQGSSEAMIQAEIIKQTEFLMTDIVTQTNMMNASAKMIDMKRSDFETEMGFLKYKDGLKKEQYMSALSLYKDITQRQDKEKYYKMDQEWEKEKFKLQEESNKIAREHNHQLQKSIILFQNEIRKGQGNFVTHPNGVYFQKNDGTIELVMKGEDLGIIPDSDYNITPYKRDDGGVTYAYFNKKTNEMGVYSLDAFGNELSEYSETGTDFKKYAKYYPNDAGPKNNNPSGITWNGGFDNPRPGTTAQLLLDNGIVYKKGRPRPSREGGYYVAFDSAEDGIKAHYLTLAVSKQTVRQRLKDWVGVGNMEEYARSVFGNSGLDLKLLDTPLNKLTPQQLNKLMIAQIGRESPGFLKSMIKEGMIKDGKIVLTPKKQEKVIKPMDKTQFDQSRNLINDFRNDKAVATFNSALDSAKDLLTSLGDGSGAGDMSAIFQFMKTLDPSSVVRESEFELAGKTSGTTEQWGLIFNKLQNGESLTDTQRKNFKKLAIQYIINKSEPYNEVYKSYSDRYKFQLGEDYYNLNFPKNRALEFNQKYNPLYIKAQQEVANIKAKKEAEENLKKGFNKVLEHGKDFYEKFKNNYK